MYFSSHLKLLCFVLIMIQHLLFGAYFVISDDNKDLREDTIKNINIFNQTGNSSHLISNREGLNIAKDKKGIGDVRSKNDKNEKKETFNKLAFIEFSATSSYQNSSHEPNNQNDKSLEIKSQNTITTNNIHNIANLLLEDPTIKNSNTQKVELVKEDLTDKKIVTLSIDKRPTSSNNKNETSNDQKIKYSNKEPNYSSSHKENEPSKNTKEDFDKNKKTKKNDNNSSDQGSLGVKDGNDIKLGVSEDSSFEEKEGADLVENNGTSSLGYGNDIFTIDNGMIKYKPALIYPHRARRFGWQGTVVMILNIDENGEVLSTKLEKSSGHELLDEEASKYAKRLQFYPFEKAGKKVSFKVRLPVKFVLSN